jgi:outer membrane lipopolysaccharide assembly protein LptE/RlpB
MKHFFFGSWAAILAAGMLLAGCGYHFSGGGALPGGVARIRIDMLENRTGEVGLEQLFTNALIYQFTRSGKASVVNGADADAVLSGSISGLGLSAIAHGVGMQTATERLVQIRLDLTLTDTGGRVLWRGRNLTDSQAYSVSADNVVTRQSEQKAIRVLSQRLAETIHNRITSDF